MLPFDEKIVDLLIPVSDANAADDDGAIALMYAARGENEQIVQLLIPVSNVNTTDKNGETALFSPPQDFCMQMDFFQKK